MGEPAGSKAGRRSNLGSPPNLSDFLGSSADLFPAPLSPSLPPSAPPQPSESQRSTSHVPVAAFPGRRCRLAQAVGSWWLEMGLETLLSGTYEKENSRESVG